MKLRKMPVYETDDQGAKIKHLSAKWYAVFVDSSEALRRLPLLEDRKASEEMAQKINAMNSIRASGDTMPPDLSRYIETMPPGHPQQAGGVGDSVGIKGGRESAVGGAPGRLENGAAGEGEHGPPR